MRVDVFGNGYEMSDVLRHGPGPKNVRWPGQAWSAPRKTVPALRAQRRNRFSLDWMALRTWEDDGGPGHDHATSSPVVRVPCLEGP